MRMVARIFFRHRGHTRAIVRRLVYTCKNAHQTHVAHSVVALKIQPKCARTVEALARLISLLIYDPGALAGPIEPTAVHNMGVLAEAEATSLLCDQMLMYWMLAQIRKHSASKSKSPT